MSNLDYKQFAERHRPHIQPPGGILFLTYRLAGSIPKATVREYKAKREWLGNEQKRIRKIAQNSNTPESSQMLERIEKFNREWFMKFEEILHKDSVLWEFRSTDQGDKLKFVGHWRAILLTILLLIC